MISPAEPKYGLDGECGDRLSFPQFLFSARPGPAVAP